MASKDSLLQLLVEIDLNRNSNFNGIGLILYQGDAKSIPISPLNVTFDESFLPIVNYEEILHFLVNASDNFNPFHDGFHLLNEKLQLTHISQYIAPKIVPNVSLMCNYGSRYRTAIYSSFMPNIVATGVLSINYGPTVFNNGVVISY